MASMFSANPDSASAVSPTDRSLSISALGNWIAAGKKNAAPPKFNPTDISSLQALGSGDLTVLPGLVNLPVCSLTEAMDNVVANYGKTKATYWPCPADV